MEAEVQELILGFDNAFLVKDLVDEIIGGCMNIEAMLDSKKVFNVVAKDGKTELRLQIEMTALCKTYENGGLQRIAWIPGPYNPADPLKKLDRSTTSTLFKIMKTNQFILKPTRRAFSCERKTLDCQI